MSIKVKQSWDGKLSFLVKSQNQSEYPSEPITTEHLVSKDDCFQITTDLLRGLAPTLGMGEMDQIIEVLAPHLGVSAAKKLIEELQNKVFKA